ncbi:MAG: RnfABCDGE type electron transport complex subunit B [Gammaproteobacteria bacterium]
MKTSDIDKIDALLPQTQCRECGYDACRPYAQAIAQGKETIDRCAPGGVTTLQALAELLQIDPTPLMAQVKTNTRHPQIATIREADCIGCTKCIQACPVDAILGSRQQMHSILSAECTGCGLCVEPCPVDCIDLLTVDQDHYDIETAKKRYQAREVRLQKQAQEKFQRQQQRAKTAKQAYIQAAVARVQANKR